MERRTFTFIALSLAILLGAQALQAWLYPPAKRDPQQEARFWRDLLMTAVQMEAVAAVAARPDDYPRKRLEEVGGACNSRYGRCGLYDRCHPIKTP